jgi:hypothetical protein
MSQKRYSPQGEAAFMFGMVVVKASDWVAVTGTVGEETDGVVVIDP